MINTWQVNVSHGRDFHPFANQITKLQNVVKFKNVQNFHFHFN